MGTTRRQYTAKFKRDAVALLKTGLLNIPLVE